MAAWTPIPPGHDLYLIAFLPHAHFEPRVTLLFKTKSPDEATDPPSRNSIAKTKMIRVCLMTKEPVEIWDRRDSKPRSHLPAIF